MHQRIRLHRRQFVVDGRQLLILGRNQLRRLLRDMRIARQNRGHRLADIADFVESEDRLIVKGRPVIGLRNELADILAGDDAMHAGERPRRGGIDAPDHPMRHGRAEHFAVKHARQAHVVRVFGTAAHLGARFKPRQLSADLLHG